MLNTLSKKVKSMANAMRAQGYRVKFGAGSIHKGVTVGRHARINVNGSGRLSIGRKTEISPNAYIGTKNGQITIGVEGFVGIGAIIASRESITIGDHALIAEYVSIRDQDHKYSTTVPTAKNGYSTAPIIVGDNVWIGARATITKGVRIGDNAVIGANSVVTSDIPANSIAVGAPARVVKTISESE